MKLIVNLSFPEDSVLFGELSALLRDKINAGQVELSALFNQIELQSPVVPPVEEPIEEPIDPPVEEPIDPPVEEPVDPPIDEPDAFEYVDFVAMGKIQAPYNWSWNCQTFEDTLNEILTVEVGDWGGFRIRNDRLDTTKGFKELVLFLAAKEEKQVRIFTSEGQETTATIGPQWSIVKLPSTNTGALSISITPIDNHGFTLFVSDIVLLDIEGYMMSHIPVDFNTYNYKPTVETIELPEPIVSTSTTQSLDVVTNQIVNVHTGETFHGRGVNIFDCRSCGSMSDVAFNTAETKGNVDFIVDQLGANFLRLCLESRITPGWENAMVNEAYRNSLIDIVNHIGTKPGVQVLVSIWNDPSVDGYQRPTENTATYLKFLASLFKDCPQVWLGVCNEPTQNYSGAEDVLVTERMQMCVDAIRSTGFENIISIPGAGGWARRVSAYLTHPVQGDNIVYECHSYDPFDPTMWYNAAQSIPVILGEFGPYDEDYGSMTIDDCKETVAKAEELGVSWLAWSLHHRCDPSILVARNSTQLTIWGEAVKLLIQGE